MYQIQGQYELQDYREANVLHRSKQALWRFASTGLVVLFGLYFLVSLFMAILGRLALEYVVPGGFFLVFYLAFQYLYIPYQIKRVFQQQKDLQSVFTLEFSEEGLQVRNAYGEGRVPWADFHMWAEDKQMFLLYRSEVSFHMLPKRLVTDPAMLDFIRRKLAEKQIPNAKNTRNPVRNVLLLILLVCIVALAVFSFSIFR